MEWISVDDKLPEDDQKVLVYHGDGFHISVSFFDKNEVLYHIESNGKRRIYTNLGWDSEIKVTHWMPLPEPPEKPKECA